MDDVVIYYNAKLNSYIVRRKVIPRHTPDNTIVVEIHAFRRRIGVTEDYLDNCREYIRLFNQKFRKQGRAMSTWPNVYMKIMRALKVHYPGIDFKTLTRQDIIDLQLPCKTVADAVRAGYLETVPGFEKLDKDL